MSQPATGVELGLRRKRALADSRLVRLLVYLITIGALLGIAKLLHEAFEHNARDKVAEQLRATLGATVRTLEASADLESQLATRLARQTLNSEIEALVRARVHSRAEFESYQALFHSRLDWLIGIDQVRGVSVLAGDGTVLVSTDAHLEGQRIDLLQRERLRDRLARNLDAITVPFTSPKPLINDLGKIEADLPVMYAVAPLLGFDGALALRYDPLVTFSGPLARGRFGITGETYAFDANARVLSETRYNDQLIEYGLLRPYVSRASLNLSLLDPGVSLAESPGDAIPLSDRLPTLMVRRALSGQPGLDLDGYRDHRGETVVGAWQWVPALDIGVATEIVASEAYSALRHATNTLWTLTGVAALLVLVLALMFELHRKQLAVRERRVEDQASALAARVSELDAMFGLSTTLDRNFDDRNAMLYEVAGQVARAWPALEPAGCELRIDGQLGAVNAGQRRDTTLRAKVAVGGRSAGELMVSYDGAAGAGAIDETSGQRLLDDFATRIGGRIERLEQVTELSEKNTALEAAHSSLERAAYFDDLTGLPNRRLFNERLAGALASARRSRQIVALMFVDLDNFKHVNDTLGHSVGDMLIRLVGERLNDCLRDSDSVTRRLSEENGSGTEIDTLDSEAEYVADELARPGGDEFMVMLTGLRHDEDAARIADRFFASLKEPFHIDGHELFATASIGIAVSPRDGDDADTLNKHADAALHYAKSSGKNDFSFYSASLGQQARQRLAIESRLRRAIERGELETYFQPVVDARTHAATGVEALVRWSDEELGFVSPGLFIPVAEDCGLIAPLGDLVLEQACTTLAKWQDLGVDGVKVGVNIASAHFAQAAFATKVRECIERSGIDPRLLVLELTERTIMLDAEDMIARLNAVKEMGVRLSVDDFGTGYSSLAYLPRFPLDILKIDIAFVRGLPGDKNNCAITTAIIAMSRSLGLATVAEGVEDSAQAEFLAENHVDELQGWRFAKAMPERECLAWVRASHAGQTPQAASAG